MKLNLKKDIVFFDIESTGLDVVEDKICQIAFIKYFTNGKPPLKKNRLINPEKEIHPDATEVHGITNDMVQNEPTFPQVAKSLFNIIGDADLVGYNLYRFDIPMLMEEFYRAGIEFSVEGRKIINVFRIFQRMEPRNLKAAYKFYCGKKLDGGHDALVDIEATAEILDCQIEMYKEIDCEDAKGNIIKKPVKNDIDTLHDFTGDDYNKQNVDYAGKIRRTEEGEFVFNFGKHYGKKVLETFQSDKSYYDWIMRADTKFAAETKKIIREIYEGKLA